MSENIKGVPIELIITKYRELGNVWKVGALFGISGQTIHARLNRIGVIKSINRFSEQDECALREKYEEYKVGGRLQELADELGRTKQFICRKAKELGLTSRPSHYDLSDERRAMLSEIAKERIQKYGHPRGALGLSHTEESKGKISSSLKEAWRTHRDAWCNDKQRLRRSDAMMASYENGSLGVRSRCYLFNVSVGGKTFTAKSSWEYDIALYLEFLKSRGLIEEWGYEPRVFRFKYNELGVRTYRPDFSVTKNGDVYYVEIKGWEDEKYSIKKMLMEKEFPYVKIIYIRAREYRMIEKKYSAVLSGWGSMKVMAGKKERICSIDGCDKKVYSKGLCRHHYYEKFNK